MGRKALSLLQKCTPALISVRRVSTPQAEKRGAAASCHRCSGPFAVVEWSIAGDVRQRRASAVAAWRDAREVAPYLNCGSQSLLTSNISSTMLRISRSEQTAAVSGS